MQDEIASRSPQPCPSGPGRRGANEQVDTSPTPYRARARRCERDAAESASRALVSDVNARVLGFDGCLGKARRCVVNNSRAARWETAKQSRAAAERAPSNRKSRSLIMMAFVVPVFRARDDARREGERRSRWRPNDAEIANFAGDNCASSRPGSAAVGAPAVELEPLADSTTATWAGRDHGWKTERGHCRRRARAAIADLWTATTDGARQIALGATRAHSSRSSCAKHPRIRSRTGAARAQASRGQCRGRTQVMDEMRHGDGPASRGSPARSCSKLEIRRGRGILRRAIKVRDPRLSPTSSLHHSRWPRTRHKAVFTAELRHCFRASAQPGRVASAPAPWPAGGHISSSADRIY